jgi:hypothetical protein
MVRYIEFWMIHLIVILDSWVVYTGCHDTSDASVLAHDNTV